MLYGFLIVIHVIISLLMIVAILMQSSKGRGLAGIAGGASSQAVFGGRQTATLLHKVTITLALVFGINALLLGALSKGRSTPTSVTQEQMEQQEANPLEFLGDAPVSQPAPEASLPAGMPAQPQGGEQEGGEQAPATEGGEE
jgi:preprotein translocase subunit SecG